ncbi:MAG: S-methyl-5-thioribose-1-phosphate isomerase [Candidatus Delongbacteria bacterium]
MEPLTWVDGALEIIDQTQLPDHSLTLRLARVADLREAIATLRLRGAPALGLAGAWGTALACREAGSPLDPRYPERVRGLALELARARPTAVNLAWGVEQVLAALADLEPGRWAAEACVTAARLHEADRAAGRAMSAAGADLLRAGGRYLTHCNAGPLATSGVGTALGVFLEGHRRGLDFEVLVDETRPLLQGARLTTLELQQAGIRVRLITDSMAAFAMQRLGVDGVFVGADRIALNGDTANKIGSYGLALVARAHGVPFHVVAPLSTIDGQCPDGGAIPIEERDATELLGYGPLRWAPAGTAAWNPAFDVVPAELIQDIVTERGLLGAPFPGAIRKALAEPAI